MVIRLLIADDQALVRGALAALLGLEHDIEVVAQVGRGDEVVEAARSSKAAVALLDIEMPGIDGITAASLLRDGARMPRPHRHHLRQAGISGARHAGRRLGLRREGHPAAELADAVRRVSQGLRVVDPRWLPSRSFRASRR